MNHPIDLWATRPSIWEEDGYLEDRFAAFEGSSEPDRLAEIRLPHRRKEFLISHVLLAAALEDYGISPACVRRDRMGKPFLEGDEGPMSVFFNLSYSEEMILCGITRLGRLGVDLESLHRPIDPGPVVKRYFAPIEQEQVLSLDEAAARARFFSIWTLKEAFLKGIGTGLRVSVLKCAFSISSSNKIEVDLSADVPHEAASWSFALIDESECRIGVAFESSDYRSAKFALRRLSPEGEGALEWLSPLAE